MTKDRFTIIGQPLPKIDAWAKVTGETRYADDLVLPRMAYAKLLRSPHPHARIVSIDTERARALPGVLGVITGHDLPPVKFGILPVSQDEEALCRDKVRLVGDAVAAVAAVDEETAERACELIDVVYEPLPAPTSCARTCSSSRATRICRWSNTRRSRSGAPTASSPSGPPRRRRTTCT